MKKLFVLSTAAVLFTVTLSAQTTAAAIKKDESKLKKEKSEIKKMEKEEKKELRKLKGNEVSYQCKEAFYSDFGNIPGTEWERTNNFDKAIFTKDGVVMKAFYDADSKLVGTTTKKSFDDLPAVAKNEINKNYKQYSKGDILLFEDNEQNESNMVLFGNQFEDADNFFVELKKDNKEIVLKVSMDGSVSFFKQLK